LRDAIILSVDCPNYLYGRRKLNIRFKYQIGKMDSLKLDKWNIFGICA